MATRHIVMNYHEAWTRGDLETARSYLADDLDFVGSIDAFRCADDFIAVLGMFREMLREITLIQSFFAENGAALLYDCDTVTPAGVIRRGEFFTIAEGKIASIRLVFDATELRKLMG